MRTLEQVKEIFENENCQLIEEKYINSKTKMRYIARCGHLHEITLDNFKAGKGRFCNMCKYKKIGERKKYEYEEIKKFFENENCILLTKEYDNANRQKLEYIAQCGHKDSITFSKFKSGSGRTCKKCSKAIKYEYDYVVEEFLNNGCQLLEDNYINCKIPMKYIATCGHIAEITFDELLNCKGISLKCSKCQKIKKYKENDVIEILNAKGCKLLSNYTKENDFIEYIAACGHKRKIKFIKFLNGQGVFCKNCASPRGEKHYAYNPNLTKEDRRKRDMQSNQIVKLRTQVYKRDNYTCQICLDSQGGNLIAHHLDAWNKYPEKRFDIDNMITLCEKCHKEFHKKYGFGGNTKEQYEEFTEKYKKHKKSEN